MKIVILFYYIFLLPVFMGYLFERMLSVQSEIDVKFWWKGFCIEIFSFLAVWKMVLFFHGDFPEICKTYIGIGVLITVSALVVIFLDWYYKKIRRVACLGLRNKEAWLPGGIFLALFLIQAVKGRDIITLYPQDYMGVYVSTIISENSLFAKNPATGFEYALSMEGVQYTGITVFYAFLASVSKVRAISILYKVIPIWMLGLFYSIQYSFGRVFFGNNIRKIWLYCIGIALINIWGTGKLWTLSHFLLCNSWTEDAMRVCILFPLFIWTLIELIWKEKRKNSMLFLLILFLIFIVGGMLELWMLAGLGIVAAILYGLKRIGV